MPIRGLPPASLVVPSAITPTVAPAARTPSTTTTSTLPDVSGLHWSTSWTEVPRTHAASTTSTFGLADRAVLGVVLGASAFAATTGAYASPIHMTYTTDIGDATATAHAVLFDGTGTDYSSMLPGQLRASSSDPAVIRIDVAAVGVSLGLTRAVGPDRPNRAADVTKVQTRLAELGYPVDIDGAYGSGTNRAIRVFEAMISGSEELSGTSGVITPGGPLDRALSSPTAPRWVEMPISGPGFRRIDVDGFSHGSSLTVDTIRTVGARYNEAWLATHPGDAPIGINDVSTRLGGPNADHESHESGLDIDVSLPTTSGDHGTTVGSGDYDREAAYAMLKAFAQDPKVERILFSDRVLLARIEKLDVSWKHKIQYGGALHRNHIHVDVKPWSPSGTA